MAQLKSTIDQDALFPFERLDVYRVARDALAVIVRCRASLRGLPGELAGQLERAAVSTVARITEGVGRAGAADRRHRFAIARAEANEAGAMIELAALYGALADGEHRRLRAAYLRVVFMLTALLRR